MFILFMLFASVPVVGGLFERFGAWMNDGVSLREALESHHAPRGMIEFWFDPESPYHRDIYGDADKTYVLFCNAEWRSALSAKSLQDMGIKNLIQLFGGLPAWREAGGPTVEKQRKSD